MFIKSMSWDFAYEIYKNTNYGWEFIDAEAGAKQWMKKHKLEKLGAEFKGKPSTGECTVTYYKVIV